MVVGVLVSVIVAIVVGVNLIPVITSRVEKVQAQGEVSTGTKGLLDMLTYVFVAMILLGAVAWIGFEGDLPSFRRSRRRGSGRAELARFSAFRDKLGLDIDKLAEKLQLPLEYIRGSENNPLQVRQLRVVLDGKTTTTGPHQLFINNRDFWWYPIERHGTYEMYKVVGLSKSSSELNCIYILGRDSHTNTPYILRCPPEYLTKPIEDCIRWNVNVKKSDVLKEV